MAATYVMFLFYLNKLQNYCFLNRVQSFYVVSTKSSNFDKWIIKCLYYTFYIQDYVFVFFLACSCNFD